MRKLDVPLDCTSVTLRSDQRLAPAQCCTLLGKAEKTNQNEDICEIKGVQVVVVNGIL